MIPAHPPPPTHTCTEITSLGQCEVLPRNRVFFLSIFIPNVFGRHVPRWAKIRLIFFSLSINHQVRLGQKSTWLHRYMRHSYYDQFISDGRGFSHFIFHGSSLQSSRFLPTISIGEYLYGRTILKVKNNVFYPFLKHRKTVLPYILPSRSELDGLMSSFPPLFF